MRLLAFSLNKPTPAFTAAMSALRSMGHTVDFFARRSFSESTQGYHGVLLSLGDVASKEAQPVKLAAMKAACELTPVLFLDRPLAAISPETFWASSVVGETTSDRVHRSEMLVALKGEWRAKIENRLAQWCPWSGGITPAFDFLGLAQSWEPTTFHFTPAIQLRKTVARFDVHEDAVDLHQIARSHVVARHRDEPIREERWSNLPIDCVRLKTVYFDAKPFHDCEQPEWMGDELPSQTAINRKLDEQITAYLGVKKLTPTESARKLDGLVRDELRALQR